MIHGTIEAAARRVAIPGRRWRANLEEAVALWPTPRAIDGRPKGNGPRPDTLTGAVTYDAEGKRIMLPTPNATDWKGPGNQRSPGKVRPSCDDGLPSRVGGHLNPTWVEWLMGYPEGWTDCGD